MFDSLRVRVKLNIWGLDPVEWPPAHDSYKILPLLSQIVEFKQRWDFSWSLYQSREQCLERITSQPEARRKQLKLFRKSHLRNFPSHFERTNLISFECCRKFSQVFHVRIRPKNVRISKWAHKSWTCEWIRILHTKRKRKKINFRSSLTRFFSPFKCQETLKNVGF